MRLNHFSAILDAVAV